MIFIAFALLLAVIFGSLCFISATIGLPWSRVPTLAKELRKTYTAYNALPVRFRGGDIYPALLAMQENAGGRAVVNEHFCITYGEWGDTSGPHVDNCGYNGCKTLPGLEKINKKISDAEKEIKATTQAELEFKNKHNIDNIDHILEAIDQEIKHTSQVRQELIEISER